MKKIVIISSYGDKNIGDAALLDMTVRFIEKSISGKLYITIQSVNPKSTTLNGRFRSTINVVASPYGIAIRSDNDKPIANYKKFLHAVTIHVLAVKFLFRDKFGSKEKISRKDDKYIVSIRDADLIFGVGGGYIRTKTHFKDLFGLSLTLLPIWIALIYKKKILFLPISFGNFANFFHKWIAVLALRKHRVFIRDPVSLAYFNSSKLILTKALFFPDLALFYPNKSIRRSSSRRYVSLSAREWLNEGEQEIYERSLANLVMHIWDVYGLKTVFVPMTWNKKEDDDNRVANRIKSYLGCKKCFETRHVLNPSEAQEIFSGALVSICTRMHSAILSFTVETPFICLAYEHKTYGLLDQLGLERWNIDIKDVTPVKLKNKFKSLVDSYREEVIQKIHINRSMICKQESKLILEIQSFSKQEV